MAFSIRLTEEERALAEDEKGQWQHRIGAYRLICHIKDDALVILALSVGHRRSIYRSQ